MSLILISGMFSSARVINSGFPITTTTCITGLWFGHIGFLLAFITLSVKTYRVFRLLGAFKRVKFTEYEAIRLCLGVTILSCLYLMFMTIFGNIHESNDATTNHNQVTRLVKCSMDYPEIHTALFVMEGILLFTGFYFAYKTKDAPDSINETSYIWASSALITIVCLLVFPLVFVISSVDPPTRQLIASTAFGIVTISVILIMFVPKLSIVFSNPTPTSEQWNNNNNQSSASKNSQQAESHISNIQSGPSTTPSNAPVYVFNRSVVSTNGYGKYGGSVSIAPEASLPENYVTNI